MCIIWDMPTGKSGELRGSETTVEGLVVLLQLGDILYSSHVDKVHSNTVN
jgi:hypothetical protein